MKTLILIVVFAAALAAQETRRETVSPSVTPAEDAKANNDSVPDGYAITGRFERILVLRFKYDTDLLAGIEKMVGKEKIRNAVILAAAGSVRGYHLHRVSNRTR